MNMMAAASQIHTMLIVNPPMVNIPNLLSEKTLSY